MPWGHFVEDKISDNQRNAMCTYDPRDVCGGDLNNGEYKIHKFSDNQRNAMYDPRDDILLKQRARYYSTPKLKVV